MKAKFGSKAFISKYLHKININCVSDREHCYCRFMLAER